MVVGFSLSWWWWGQTVKGLLQVTTVIAWWGETERERTSGGGLLGFIDFVNQDSRAWNLWTSDVGCGVTCVGYLSPRQVGSLLYKM